MLSTRGLSRRVLAWRRSITLATKFCHVAVSEALARHGKPEVFNTGQGSQFTSVSDARASFGRYLDFYNARRPHSSLGARMPEQAYIDFDAHDEPCALDRKAQRMLADGPAVAHDAEIQASRHWHGQFGRLPGQRQAGRRNQQ